MSVTERELDKLRELLSQGHKVAKYEAQGGVCYFILPTLEYADEQIHVPSGPPLEGFLKSKEFADALLRPVRVAVALLDIVGFSGQPDDVQLAMIVRYQCLVRSAVRGARVRKLISIGDGTVFVFDETAVRDVPGWLFATNHALAGFNLDFAADGAPTIAWRMGVHVGSAYVFRDINGDENYIGTAVNLAQRVSTCVPRAAEEAGSPDLDSTIYVSQAARDAFTDAGVTEFEFCDAGQKTVKGACLGHVYAMTKLTREVVPIRR